MSVDVVLASDDSIAVIFDNRIDVSINRQVIGLRDTIADREYPGIIELVPSYHVLQIYFDTLSCDYNGLMQWVEESVKVLEKKNKCDEYPVKVVPVCYDKRVGLDIEEVCDHNNIDIETLVRLHCEQEYLVYMIGFTPGFPYLGGMNPKIATPRKATPRLKILSGSVGIAGEQTGIYPVNSPGGWQIIGRTPLKLFDSSSEVPFALNAGEKIRFESISYEEYLSLGGTENE